MPNRDGTGPNGQGPKTGRQRGNCQNRDYNFKGFGKGCGRCCGGGKGFEGGFWKGQDS